MHRLYNSISQHNICSLSRVMWSTRISAFVYENIQCWFCSVVQLSVVQVMQCTRAPAVRGPRRSEEPGGQRGHGEPEAQKIGGPLAVSRIFLALKDIRLNTQMLELVENRQAYAIQKIFKPTLCKMCSLRLEVGLQTHK